MTAGAFDPRLTTYFGDATLQAGFLPLPHLFLRHYAELGLSGQQAMFVMQIMAVSWDLGKPPTTLSDIAGRMGIARRTAQGISAQLHTQGLIQIYDQYDDGGAQTENAYDLRPLFARLAAFAPTSTPAGRQRQQHVRTQAPSTEHDASMVLGSVSTSPSPASTGVPPQQNIASPPSRIPHPPLDPVIQPPRQETARPLTESKNLPKKQGRIQEQQQAVAAEQLEWFGREEQQGAGRSLRWDTQLSPLDVHHSRQILARIGLNADVADQVAQTLHPAEVWALWLHARAAGLGIAWIARQLYDPQRKQPRMAGIPGPCETAGRLLTALSPDTASTVIDIMVEQVRDREGLVTSEAALAADPRTAGQDLTAPITAVWVVLDSARWSGPGQTRAPATPARDAGRAPQVEDPRWLLAKSHLATRIPPGEYATWIEPLELVHVDDAVIVVGVPNVFVRTEIQHEYAAALQEALDLAWGRAVTFDVVIEQALAA